MNPPNSTTTPWPTPLSPRLHERVAIDDAAKVVEALNRRAAVVQAESLRAERLRGLAEFAASRHKSTTVATQVMWQPQSTAAIRRWTPVNTAKPAKTVKAGPRHARIQLPAPPRDLWVRWTPLDLPLAALMLLTLAAIVHLTAARDIVVRQHWYVEVQIWLAVHERHSCHEFPAPRRARAVTAAAPAWTFDTLTLNTVVTEWTNADTAARIGAGR